ncbi:MAG: transglutaminase domain-containing protein [Comamonadaceae bacterium]|nr:transglutaminase domain-containing protein [Comamonadaceae bacterium]
MDEFWLDRKLGFCEHFAAAFVVVMRALDVPARIVTGYQGADADAGGRLLDRAPARRPRLGRVLAARRAAGCASTRPPRWRPSACGAAAACAPQPGLRGRRASTPSNPALAARLREAWETREQPLEPVGAELLARPAVRPAARARRRRAELAGPGHALIGLLGARPRWPAPAGRWWDRRRQDPWQRLQRARAAAAGRAGRERVTARTRRARARGRARSGSATAARRWRAARRAGPAALRRRRRVPGAPMVARPRALRATGAGLVRCTTPVSARGETCSTGAPRPE